MRHKWQQSQVHSRCVIAATQAASLDGGLCQSNKQYPTDEWRWIWDFEQRRNRGVGISGQQVSYYRLCCCANGVLLQVIVFFPTDRAARFHAALARASGVGAYDLHSNVTSSLQPSFCSALYTHCCR
jgi:hypothetical protein